MAWLFAVPVLVFLVVLVVGGLTRRVKLKSCCGVADPRHDLRMRDAFADEAAVSDGCARCPDRTADGSKP